MKCHYEVLDIPRDADESEIKLAYKKLALKWHPDKNLENIEHATEQFQLIQQAYEILSDRQERAWYDNHREQILRSADSNFTDNNLDVYQYFTTTCFKGYGDDNDDFYTVYRSVFEQIAKEDLEYMDKKEDYCNIPMFGYSTSDYDEIVAPFYDFWLSYSTKKSYVWLDVYNIKEAKNRRISKLMDKENDKIKQKAKKERNEEVRNLVAFIRKRDKRVQAHTKLLEARKLENRQKQERLSKLKRLERLKQLNESSDQAEWMKFENVKSELEEIEKRLAEEFGDEDTDNEQSSNTEEELEHLYCVACNKIFKNPKAFENHEFSKRHKDNVDQLKENMIDEDEEYEDTLEMSSVEVNLNISNITDKELLSSGQLESISRQKKSKRQKKNKKSKNLNISDHQNGNNLYSDCNKSDHFLQVESDEDVVLKDEKRQRLKRDEVKLNKCQYKTDANNTDPKIFIHKKEVLKDGQKLKNKGQRKELRKNKTTCEHTIENDKNQCAVCKEKFESKNKLFDHLKKTGHSVYIPPSGKIGTKSENLC